MSFFDPVLDAFAGLDDTINEEIPGGWATIAAITAATMGAPTPGVDPSAMGSWDVLPAVGEGVTAITPQTIGAAGAMAPYETAVPGIMGANATPVIPQTPIVGQPIAPLSSTPLPVAGSSPATTAGDLTARGITTVPGTSSSPEVIRESLGKQVVPDYTKPFSGADRAVMNSNMGYQGSELPMPTVGSTPTANPFMDGLGTFGRYLKQGYDLAEEYPKTAMAGAYLGAKGLGLLDPKEAPAQEKYNGVLTRYKMSPDFQASNAQPNVYKPTYAAAGGIMQAGGPVEQMSMNAVGGNQGYPQSSLPYSGYASPTASPIPQNVVQGDAGDVGINPQTGQERFAQGGIAHFSRGNLARTLDFYKSMTESQAKAPAGPSVDHGPGIYYDQDPDTRYQDALTAAQIRQAKVNKRANVSAPVAKRPTPMGQLNLRPPGAKADAAGSSLDPENAAQGGIMHSSLGGYAAGGNPRLLKGPGDGMSDNIPATIAGKQPARLADGEFVIPADVVSHLGNGSTDAGAKRLHEMMNKIRKARTGNSKQGKQINPNKFMPA
jgi:hypothetical protein